MDNQNNVDDQALEAQGYTRAMPRRFSPLSLLSLGFAMTATWNGFGSAIETSLAEASSSGTIWTLIIAALMNLVVSLGMAELVSAYPNSGAQYYWSFRVARSDWAPFASYMQVSLSMVLAMLHLCVEGYTVSPWHQWLCYTSVLWLAVAFNIFGTRLLPTFNRLLLYFSLSTLLISVVIILGCAAPNFQSTTWVFADLKSSNQSYVRGFLLILCLLNNTYGFMGTDAGAHLAEEIPSPATNAPKVIVYPIIIGLVTAWPFAVACMYVIVDIEKVVNPPSGIGLIEIYYQATGSKALTIILLAAFSFCLFGCAVANITGSSRQIWAASRDNCYPLSTWWSRIHPQFQMPVNAAVLSAIFTTLYGLIYVGSTTAFTSMVSANIVFMMTSYVIPQGILAWRGRSTVLPGRPFDLGKWGQLVNVTSCLWVAFLDVVACFPTTLPVTASNMNWVSVVILAFAAYTLMAWCLWQRHVFKGPGVNLLVQEQYALIPRDSNDGVSKDVKGE